MDVCIEVLKVINRGSSKPTRIMYKSNISWVPLAKILKFLEDNGNIIAEDTGNRKTYYITEKGKNILRYHQQFMTMLTEETGSLPA